MEQEEQVASPRNRDAEIATSAARARRHRVITFRLGCKSRSNKMPAACARPWVGKDTRSRWRGSTGAEKRQVVHSRLNALETQRPKAQLQKALSRLGSEVQVVTPWHNCTPGWVRWGWAAEPDVVLVSAPEGAGDGSVCVAHPHPSWRW